MIGGKPLRRAQWGLHNLLDSRHAATMKLALGRIVSILIPVGGWLLAGVRIVLDLVGYLTLPDDAKVAAVRVDQIFQWLLTVPGWVVYGFALLSTMWLAWVSWPRAPRMRPAGTSSEPTANISKPASKGSEVAAAPAARRQADMKKVALIDEIYPQLHDLSEEDVDRLGNHSGLLKDYFLLGAAPEYYEVMNQQLRAVGDRFEGIRKILQRNRMFDDIYRMEDPIAQRISAIGTAIGGIRQRAEKMSHRFDENSIDLISEDVLAMRQAIGGLRQYLFNECLGSLRAMRKDEMSRGG